MTGRGGARGKEGVVVKEVGVGWRGRWMEAGGVEGEEGLGF